MYSSKEHIKNILVATSAAIPIAGGPLSIILDKYIPTELTKRKDNLLESISNDLNNHKKHIKKDRLESSEYLTTFIKVFQKALNEHRIEKINAFQNILINEAISDSKEFDELSLYIRLIDDLTIDQIKILHYIYNNELKGNCSQRNSNNIYNELQKIWPNVDKYYLYACMTELLRFFIISSSKDTLDENSKKGHSLTNFGKRFVNYIFSPNEIYKESEKGEK